MVLVSSAMAARSHPAPLASHEAARCNSLIRPPACPRTCTNGGQAIQAGNRPDTNGFRPTLHEWRVTVKMVSNLCEQGHVSEGVEALGCLVEGGWGVPASLFYSVLKACVLKEDVVVGRRVHAFMVRQGYWGDSFLCNHMLRMYASHGRLGEAMDVFGMVPEPDAFMWSSIISAHVKCGRDKQALDLYGRMSRSSVKADGHVFVAALQACARGRNLRAGQELHADVLACGLGYDLFVGNGLVDMYAKCGSLEDARRVFDGLGQKDVVTWTALIAGYSQHGMGKEALRVYRAMQEEGVVVPNSVTFVSLLQACASVGTSALETGKELHSHIREGRHSADVLVANSLVNMYAKCGSLEEAQRVFDGLGQKDVVTWTALIAGYSQQGMGQEAIRLYSAMQLGGIAVPNSITFVCLLQACASVGSGALEKGKELHTQIRKLGHESDVYVGSSLVNMYAKCGSLEDAQNVFDNLAQKNVVTWTALIAGYSQQDMGPQALSLYSVMQAEGIAVPNAVTFVCLLQACVTVGFPALEIGKQLHAQIREQGHGSDVFVASSLVCMYVKCGSLEDGRRVFDQLGQKGEVAWNAMVAGLSQEGRDREALSLYREMQEEGISVSNSVTFVCLLQACASLGTPALETGKQLHTQLTECGHQADVFVASSLVNMYAKCGSVENAQAVFDGLVEKNVVTWTAMIGGFSQHGMGQEALRLYSAMQGEGIVVPNAVTFVCLLQACASLGAPALEEGKQLHTQLRELGHQADAFVANGVVNMYAKCGSLEDAQKVFEGLGQKDVVTWNAMIAGYSQQGMGQEALGLYRAMQEEGTTVPDSVTFLSLLQACANVAALHLGRELHAQIEEQGLQVDMSVASSLIHMYGKCGSMFDAQLVFDALPKRNSATWGALIAGYSSQGDSVMVFLLVERMKEDGIQPGAITFLSVLTVCSHAGLVNRGRDCFDAMSRQYGINPAVEHYTCMVDLLGRAGQLDEALAIVRAMSILPDSSVWHTLLGACQKWRNVEVGRQAFDQALKLDEQDAVAYVLMCNIYRAAQMWEEARKVQVRRTRTRAWKQAGQSWWTDIDGLVHSFLVGDEKQPERFSRQKVHKFREAQVCS